MDIQTKLTSVHMMYGFSKAENEHILKYCSVKNYISDSQTPFQSFSVLLEQAIVGADNAFGLSAQGRKPPVNF